MNELALNQNSALANQIDRIIVFYNIDPDLFKKKLAERLMFSSVQDIEHKTNYLLAIIRAMIKEEHLENTAFEKMEGYCLHNLIDTMRNLGIKVDPNEVRLMELYFERIKNLMKPSDIKKWIGTGIAFVINSENKTSAEFISLFKRTQSMKRLNLNHEEIENQYQQEMEQWKQLIN